MNHIEDNYPPVNGAVEGSSELFRKEVDRANSLAPGAVMPEFDQKDILDSKQPKQLKKKGNPGDKVDIVGSMMQELYKHKIAAQQARLHFAEGYGYLLLFTLTWATVLADTILIGFGTKGIYFQLQLYVFIVSTVLSATYHVAIALLIDAPELSIFRKLAVSMDGPQILDWIFIVIGWIFIEMMPGIAALRCFRIIRQLWHFDNFYRSLSADSKLKPFLFYLAVCCRQTIRYFDKIGEELFSSKSRGGLSILGIYFFTSYLFAVLFWLELGDVETSRGQPCRTLSHCYITTMRLSVFDEGGLDYMSAVQEHRSTARYTILFIIYIVFTSVVLMNGLIGAFGYGLVLAIRGKDKQAVVVPVERNQNANGAGNATSPQAPPPDPLLDPSPEQRSVEKLGYTSKASIALDIADSSQAPFRSMKLGNIKQIAVSQSQASQVTEVLNNFPGGNATWKVQTNESTTTTQYGVAPPESARDKDNGDVLASARSKLIVLEQKQLGNMLQGMKTDMGDVSSTVLKLLQELQDIKSKL